MKNVYVKNKYKLGLMSCVLSIALLSGCAGADGNADTPQNTAAEEEQNTEKEADVQGTSEPKSTSANKKSTLSLPVFFQGQDIEGNEVSSEIFSESKLTMLNVWATYCNPCLQEMPDLGELAEEYDAAEFQVIGIISDVQEGAEEETLSTARELIEQTGADYSHLLLNESIYKALLTEVTAVPTTFFLNENGMVLDTVVGSMEKTAWEEKINALLEEL